MTINCLSWVCQDYYSSSYIYDFLIFLYHFNQLFYLASAQFICYALIHRKQLPSFWGILSVSVMILPFYYIYPDSNHQIIFILKSFSLFNFSLFLIYKHNRVFTYSDKEIFMMFLYLIYSVLMVINHLGFIDELDSIYNINYVYSVLLLLVLATLIWRERFIEFVTKKVSIGFLLLIISILAYFQADEFVFLIQCFSFFLLVVVFYLAYQLSVKKSVD
ncbi:MAG: hypothetical protein KDD94_02145 [Calditrichaeota bacterium]|nr:hypothetical protein [Calditrichota bacterium]